MSARGWSTAAAPGDPDRVREVQVLRYQNGHIASASDDVAAEEPLSIQIANESVALIMRTPGHDVALACGFLFSEGIVRSRSDVLETRPAVDRDGYPQPNALDVAVTAACAERATRQARRFPVTASCGVCGARTIEEACARAEPIRSAAVVAAEVLLGLEASLREAQQVFARTGGLHAAGLFDLSGRPILAREDVGRHNAVDKVVGELLLAGRVPLTSSILMVSGRASFELVQKAAIAGIPFLAAVGAPSSLAVEAADAMGLTLVGLLREQRFVAYTHPERIRVDRPV
jgi:FdhD protein